jgi:hypothetical protein
MQPGFVVSPDCPIVIKTLPALLQADTNTEDCVGPDQAANALRYLVMSRPGPPETVAPPIGRNLAALPPKVAADIQRMREYEGTAEQTDVLMGDPGWPFGLDWGGSSTVVD